MIDPRTISAFSDEIEKIALNVAQSRIADKAYKMISGATKARGVPMTTAQTAAHAQQVGKEWSPGLMGRVSRAMEAAPEAGMFTKTHRQGMAREWKAKGPTKEYVEQHLQKNPDMVAASGRRRGILERFRRNWDRGEAYQLPQAAPA